MLKTKSNKQPEIAYAYFIRNILILIVIICNIHILRAQEYTTIITKEAVVSDTFYNNYVYSDKYRWLESVQSTDTKEWIANQNKQSKKYLARASNKNNSKRAIDKFSYTEYDNPVKKGNYYFTYAYYNDLGVPALFYQSSLKSRSTIIGDPNFISKKDKIVLKGYSVSHDSKYLAYQFSRNGSDWAELKIVTLGYKVTLDEHLKGLKFSSIVWHGDGFFYSTFAQKGEFGRSVGQKVYYHKVGTEQSEDKLIFYRKNNPSAQFYTQVTSDERFVLIKERNEKDGKINIFYFDYKSDNPHLKPLLTNLTYDVNILDSYNGKFVATTSYESNNGNIVLIDPENPLKWQSIVSEYSEAVLLEVIPFQDRLVAVYQTDQCPAVQNR